MIKKFENRDAIKAIALDIGKEVCCHIEIMYPNAIEAASSTFLTSVCGCVVNQIMYAFDPRNEREISSTLMENARFRKYIRQVYRDMRNSKRSMLERRRARK